MHLQTISEGRGIFQDLYMEHLEYSREYLVSSPRPVDVGRVGRPQESVAAQTRSPQQRHTARSDASRRTDSHQAGPKFEALDGHNQRARPGERNRLRRVRSGVTERRAGRRTRHDYLDLAAMTWLGYRGRGCWLRSLGSASGCWRSCSTGSWLTTWRRAADCVTSGTRACASPSFVWRVC